MKSFQASGAGVMGAYKNSTLATPLARVPAAPPVVSSAIAPNCGLRSSV